MKKIKVGKILALLLAMILVFTVGVHATVSYVGHQTDSIKNTMLIIKKAVNGLAINMTVEHPLGAGYEIPDNISFEFEVDLGLSYADKVIVTSDGEKTADENGKITVTVKPGVPMLIEGIYEDTQVKVTVTEKDADGFAIKNGETSKDATIIADDSVIVDFINVYSPASVKPNGWTVTGTKILEGRDWENGDVFTFKLEKKSDDGNWAEIGTKTVKNGATQFNFNEIVNGLVFDEVGTYSLRISEVKGDLEGVEYDTIHRTFDIIVTDVDMDGSLEISGVDASDNTSVNKNAAGGYDISVSFKNKYTPVPFEPDIIRLGGLNRIETAFAISNEGWPDGADTVLLANGLTFADALAAVPLGYELDAPILLTYNNVRTIDSTILAQMQKLGNKKVIIIGGVGVINAGIEQSLKDEGFSVERIYGSDRFATAVEIATKLDTLRGGKPKRVFVTSGMDYPDALAAGPIASRLDAPILFTIPAPKSTVLQPATADYLDSIGFNGRATIIGGSGVIAGYVADDLKEAGATAVDRVFGLNRYETSFEIYKTFKDVFVSKDVTFATGSSFPDALTGGVFAAKRGMPVFLVDEGRQNDEIKATLRESRAKNIYIFGGIGAVADSTVSDYISE